MKIVGAGLSRTGTTSLHRALNFLGFRSLHYAPERLADILDGRARNPSFRRYDDVDAVVDVPAAFFYRELLEAYPESSCILTLRHEDDWWSSISGFFARMPPFPSPEQERLRQLVRTCVYGS